MRRRAFLNASFNLAAPLLLSPRTLLAQCQPPNQPVFPPSSGCDCGGTGDIRFVTLTAQTNARNDLGGYLGFKFHLIEQATITALGMYVLPGNSNVHEVSFWSDAPRKLRTVNIDTSKSPPNAWCYCSLDVPLTIIPQATFYLMATQTVGKDAYLDAGTTHISVSGIAVGYYAWWSPDGITWNAGQAACSWVGTNFLYH